MTDTQAPVLIIGGSGVVGSQAAHTLRQLQPRLPIAIGGRDLARAEAIAAEVGNASAVKVDIALPDLGLPQEQLFSALVVFLKDERLNSLRIAQSRGVPYISLSSGTFEIGPEVAQYIHAPNRSPIVLASHWLAGASLFPALEYAKDFRHVDAIRIGVLLDEEDMGGAAAYADFERITGSSPAALTLQHGKFAWRRVDDAGVTYVSVDGREVAAQRYSPFDIMSLATATHARSVSMNLAYTASASRLRGEPFSTEIVIDIEGTLHDGKPARRHSEIVHPAGQAPLTGLNIALIVERVLGIAGREAPHPGLYFPELLLESAHVVRKMEEFGARFSDDRHEIQI
jgi:hypothetical protein